MKALAEKRRRQAALLAKGDQVNEHETEAISSQMAKFKTKLEEFALSHASKVKKDPVFRRDFQKMCDAAGVDVLVSQKSVWSELLGLSDFYYSLGVEIVEVCLSSRGQNGGLISLDEVHRRLLKRHDTPRRMIHEDDIERAIRKLEALGSGLSIHTVAGRKLVQSVPTELSQDHAKIFAEATTTGFTTIAGLCNALSWTATRAEAALDQMIQAGMVWIDDQAATRHFWLAGFTAEAHM